MTTAFAEAPVVAYPTVDLLDEIVKILESAGGPLTLTKILESCSKSNSKKALKEDLRVRLAEAVKEQKLFLASTSKANSPAYWDKDESAIAEEKVKSRLFEGQLPEKEVVDYLRLNLGTTPPEKWCKELIKRLVDGSVLFVVPKLGRLPQKLSVTPFKLEFVLEGVLADFDKLASSKSILAAKITRESLASTLIKMLGVINTSIIPASNPTTVSMDIDEVKDLLLKVMSDIDPQADRGAMVSLKELRESMPSDFRAKHTFDQAVLELQRNRVVDLHAHHAPANLTEEERSMLVEDSKGKHFVGISKT